MGRCRGVVAELARHVFAMAERPMDDTRVRQLAAAGHANDAATEALRSVGPQVVRYLRSILHDEDDTRDAFSHFAEILWRTLPSFRWECSLRTWAHRLAWSAALRVQDEAWRRHERRLATDEASEIAEKIRTSTLERYEHRREELERIVATLPLEEQSLLALRVRQGLSWAEIAVVFATEGTPVDELTLAKRFSRLKARLSRLAKEQGLLD